MLIDCPAGKEESVEAVLERVGSPNVKTVVLTHWDRDHYGGVLSLIRASNAPTFHYNHDTLMAWDEDRNLRRAALRELLEPEFEISNSIRQAAACKVIWAGGSSGGSWHPSLRR